MKSGGDKATRILMVLAALLLVTAVGIGAFLFGRSESSTSTSAAASPEAEFNYSVLNEVKRILGDDYVKQENLDDQSLFEAAVTGMLDILNDEGTYYVNPSDHKLDTTLTGSFDGIGATISQQNSEIVIVAPIKDTPAEKAGLKSGDVILEVDGQSTKGWTVDKTVLNIRGPKGTQVDLKIKHDDGQEKDYKITRATVQVDSVTTAPPGGALRDESGAVVDNIGYIQIREFSRRTAQELDVALKDVIGKGAKALIIDVRYNPGGLLNTVIQSADLLMDNGTIAIQRDATGKETVFAAKSGQAASNLPIVVLQNKYSASASEILAAALRDNGRATVIGEKSYGKGTVNTARDLSNGGALYVSIAHWLTPGGALIDKVGVRPDIEIVPTDEDIDLRRDPQLQRAVTVLRGQVRAQ